MSAAKARLKKQLHQELNQKRGDGVVFEEQKKKDKVGNNRRQSQNRQAKGQLRVAKEARTAQKRKNRVAVNSLFTTAPEPHSAYPQQAGNCSGAGLHIFHVNSMIISFRQGHHQGAGRVEIPGCSRSEAAGEGGVVGQQNSGKLLLWVEDRQERRRVMEVELAETMVRACEQNGIKAEVLEHYSASWMRGRKTTGVVVTNTDLAQVLTAVIANAPLFVEGGTPKFAIKENLCVGTFRLSLILY